MERPPSAAGTAVGSLVVAIDGPAGSGKSTVARHVARQLRLRYLDTGAMYRAVTWAALDRGVAVDDAETLSELATSLPLEVSSDPRAPTVRVGGADVTAEVRSRPVTEAVSAVSAVPGVRVALVARQRGIIGAGGIVVEGRDIGTVVAPAATVKVFLTASADERARRRSAQTTDPAGSDLLVRTKADLARRDQFDSGRRDSPLAVAPDAVVLDTTGTTVDQVVADVLALVHAGAPTEAGP